MSEVFCGCRMSSKHSRLPSCPLKHDPGIGWYLAGPTSRIAVSHCHFCGGRLHEGAPGAEVRTLPEPAARDTQPCSCVRIHAAEPAGPLKYDERLNEYELVYDSGHGRSSYPVYHCPWCGTRMPESKRSELFNTPDPADLAHLSTRLEGARTVRDVIARLGEPDRVWPGFNDDERQRVLELPRILRQLDYLRLSPTVQVIVQEREDGSVSWNFCGLPLPGARREP